jgi:hypothetical protein
MQDILMSFFIANFNGKKVDDVVMSRSQVLCWWFQCCGKWFIGKSFVLRLPYFRDVLAWQIWSFWLFYRKLFESVAKSYLERKVSALSSGLSQMRFRVNTNYRIGIRTDFTTKHKRCEWHMLQFNIFIIIRSILQFWTQRQPSYK